MVKVLIKKLSKDIKFPNYKTRGSSGLDLIANLNRKIENIGCWYVILFFEKKK